MNISPTTPVSGMNAASFRMDNTANNVANVNTQGFQAQRVEQVETAAARTGTDAVRPAQQATDTYEPGTGTDVYAAGTAQTDLARDMTDMTNNRNSYAANAEVVRTQDEMTGVGIDLVG